MRVDLDAVEAMRYFASNAEPPRIPVDFDIAIESMIAELRWARLLEQAVRDKDLAMALVVLEQRDETD